MQFMRIFASDLREDEPGRMNMRALSELQGNTRQVPAAVRSILHAGGVLLGQAVLGARGEKRLHAPLEASPSTSRMTTTACMPFLRMPILNLCSS